MTRSLSSETSAARQVVDDWLAEFERALAQGDTSAAANLFRTDGYLRDLLALTLDLRTFSGRDEIGAGLKLALGSRTIDNLSPLDGDPEVFERRRHGDTIEAFFTFETDIAHCRGHLRLLRSDEGDREWRAWTLAVSLEDFKDYPEEVGALRRRSDDARHGGRPGEVITAADHAARYYEEQPDVVVIGAGQGGLTAAARLRQLGVPTLIIERHPRVGDNWRNRYQSLVLHNQVWANHLPYLPFPASWPQYLSKDQIADWLEHYAKILGLAVWTSTELLPGASYDPAAQRWTLAVRTPDGTERTVTPKHLVLATGVFGVPNRTHVPDSEKFAGRFLHAADYRGSDGFEGQRVLVVGAGSSAHDVAQDLVLHGADVTMLQRSSTCVISVEPGAARWYSIYSENGAPITDCDLITNSFPFNLQAELHRDMTSRIAELDADLLDGLRRAGFAIDFGEDGSGFLMKYHRTGGGYYINVGASELIIEGKIKVKQGAEIVGIDGRTVRYSDTDSADFDAIVVATGYQNMSEAVRRVLGDEIADRVGPIWGIDDEGELRNMWKRTPQPGLWICGGSLQECRPYSKYLALQIKAGEVGLLP